MAGLSVDVSSMLDAKDGDLAPFIVDHVENPVVTLSESVRLGVSVELFALRRPGVCRQVQNELVDSYDVVGWNVCKRLGGGFLDEDSVQLLFPEHPLPHHAIGDGFLSQVFLDVLDVLQVLKAFEKPPIVLQVEDDRFPLPLVVNKVRFLFGNHLQLRARQT